MLESGGDKDKDNGSDLRADAEEYPAGWNFALEIPRSQYRPPVELPAEPTGRGVNRHVYFCSTDLADEWVELPPATPHQINVTRRIKKFLTGNLDEVVTSYPSFPGTERNYLRAMIARISAGTHIAPRGFYKTGEEGADDDDASEDDDDDASLSEFTFTILKLLLRQPQKAEELSEVGKKLLNKIKLLRSLHQLQHEYFIVKN